MYSLHPIHILNINPSHLTSGIILQEFDHLVPNSRGCRGYQVRFDHDRFNKSSGFLLKKPGIT